MHGEEPAQLHVTPAPPLRPVPCHPAGDLCLSRTVTRALCHPTSQLCITSPKGKAESGGTATSEGDRPGAQHPSGHLPGPRHAPCSHPKSHTVRFSPPQLISCLCNKSPRGRTACFQPRSPLGPAPPCPGAVRCGHPVVPGSGRLHPTACRGILRNRGVSTPARQVLSCFSGFCPSAGSCKAAGCGQDVPAAPGAVWPAAGGESGAGRTLERRGPAAPRLSSEHPLPSATAPPRARPRGTAAPMSGAPGAGQRPQAGRHRVPAAALHKRCWRYPGREVLSSDPQPGGSLRREPLAAPARPGPVSPLHASLSQAAKTQEELQGGIRNRRDSHHAQAKGKDER